MNFKEAFYQLKLGKKIKLPSWGGYWVWEDDTIMMYCKDGRIINIKDMENVNFTMENICSDDWILATEGNIKIKDVNNG